MIKIGCVNIDTSHPMGFAQAMEKNNKAKYVAVYNDSFRDIEEVEGFAKRFNVDVICQSLDEMCELCDIVFIQGCNWDDHLRCAEVFINRKIPVFIDKPIVGNLQDCNKLLEYAKKGAVILGASSVRYALELQEFISQDKEERGEVVSVHISCGVDDYNYGCHIIEALGTLLGAGAEFVKYIGKSEVNSVYTESGFIGYNNGTGAVFTTMTGLWLPFDIVIYTTKGAFPIRLDSSKLYDALIDEICNFMLGDKNNMASVAALTESVKISLCMIASKSQNGKAVALSDLTEDMPSFDGEEFCEKYAKASTRMYSL